MTMTVTQISGRVIGKSSAVRWIVHSNRQRVRFLYKLLRLLPDGRHSLCHCTPRSCDVMTVRRSENERGFDPPGI